MLPEDFTKQSAEEDEEEAAENASDEATQTPQAHLLKLTRTERYRYVQWACDKMGREWRKLSYEFEM